MFDVFVLVFLSFRFNKYEIEEKKRFFENVEKIEKGNETLKDFGEKYI